MLHADLVSFSFRSLRDLLVSKDLSQCRHVPGRLVAVVVLTCAVKNTEEVVVGAGNEFPVVEPESRTIIANNEQRHFVCSLTLYIS